MTKQEAKKVIIENQDKPLNELKRMIKNNMTQEQREKFTYDNLIQLITEINQERQKETQKETQKVSHKKTRNTRKIEGEGR